MTTPLAVHEGLLNGIRESLNHLAGLVGEVVVAGALLLIGILLGRWAEGVIVKLGRRVEFDEIVGETPLSTVFADRKGAASEAFGTLANCYVVLVAVFAGVTYVGGFDTLQIWLSEAVTYVPIFAAGVVLLIVGLYVADRVAAHVANSATAQATGVPEIVEDVTEAVLVFVAVVIALDTIGVHVGILYTFGEIAALAVGLALALAVGIAVGWGGKDYVADNVDDWMESREEPGSAASADD